MRSNADDVPWTRADEREHWDEVDSNESSANDDGADVDAERRAENERRADQAEADAERGGEGDTPPAGTDAAEIDQQLERAEGEGMVTEHAKVSATDPGPEPLPEPEPEPAPDHGPGDDPEWEPEREPD